MKTENKMILYLISLTLVLSAAVILYNFWTSPKYTPVTVEKYIEYSSEVANNKADDLLDYFEDAVPENDSNEDAKSENNSYSGTSNNKKSSSSNAPLSTSNKININTAGKESLMRLNGIGEVKAQAIIDYRNENGAFNSIEELLNVSGIGEKTFEKIKSYVTV